ncbi:hypothetical protein CR513_62176, partial [Mucuna pruriens]
MARSNDNFPKNLHPKEAWNILEKDYISGKKVKEVCLQVLRRQYKLMQMEDLYKGVRWCMSMKVLFGFQEVLEIMKGRY